MDLDTKVASWHWGPTSREDISSAFQALNNGLPTEDGVFVIRQREVPGEHSAAIWYKGRVTHHLIAKDNEGLWTLNKKRWACETDDLFKFIESFKYVIPGFPVRLNRSLKDPDATDPEWLHGAMESADATKIMETALAKVDSEDGNGTFFIRKKPGSPHNHWALVLQYRGKVTHHQLIQNDDEAWTINTKTFGKSGPLSLAELVEQFYAPVPGWPIVFKRAVARNLVADGVKAPATQNTAAPARKGSTAKRRNSSASGRRRSTQSVSSIAGETTATAPVWLHGPLSKEDSSEVVKDFCGGQYEHGAFLVRERGDDGPNEFVLVLGYQKAPDKPTMITHHHIVARVADKVFTINKKVHGEPQTTLTGLIEQLRSPVKGWPVVLSKPVPVPPGGLAPVTGVPAQTTSATPSQTTSATPPQTTAAKPPPPAAASTEAAVDNDTTTAPPPSIPPRGEPGPTAAKPASSATTTPPFPVWLHGALTKEESGEVVEAYCGGEYEHGAFLVRERAECPGEYVLVVGFQKDPARTPKITHHHITQRKDDDDVFVINKKAYGDPPSTTLTGLIELLQSPVNGWPVVLSKPVPVPPGGMAPTVPLVTVTAPASTLDDVAPPVRPSKRKPPALQLAAPEEREAHANPPTTPAPSGAPPQTRQTPEWLHGVVDKPTCQRILEDASPSGRVQHGSFFVRELENADGQQCYGLVLGYQKRAAPEARVTHHLITFRPSDGIVTISNKVFGTPSKYLGDVIDQLRNDSVEGWPCKLTILVPIPSGGAQPQNPLLQPGGAPGSTSTSSGGGGGGGSGGNRFAVGDAQLWMHGECTRQHVEDTLVKWCEEHSDARDGAWLVRKRPPFQPTSPEYVIAITYQGRVTHHLVAISDGAVTLNGTTVNNVATLEDLLRMLHTKPAYWDVAMEQFVPHTYNPYDSELPQGAPAASAIPTVTPSATTTGQLGENEYETTLVNAGSGIGVKMDVGLKQGGVFLTGVKAGSPAAVNTELIPGSQFLSVNGTDVRNATKKECIALLKAQDTLALVLRNDADAFASRHLDALSNTSPASHVSFSLKTQAGKGVGIKIASKNGKHFVSAVKRLTHAALSGMFRKGMAFVSLNGVDCNTMTRKELIDTIIASDNMDLVMQDNMSEFSEDAKPSYDAHGGAAVFVGGGMGESTVDAGVKFTYIMPPSNAQMLATYFATRPKIVFVLSRPDTATSWGLEFTKALPLTVKHVSDILNPSKSKGLMLKSLSPVGRALCVSVLVGERLYSRHKGSVAHGLGIEAGDIIQSVNGSESTSQLDACMRELTAATYELEIHVARYYVGGLTEQAQNAKIKAVQLGYTTGEAVCPDVDGAANEIGYVLDLTGVTVASSSTDRYAEEDQYHESGNYYDDE